MFAFWGYQDLSQLMTVTLLAVMAIFIGDVLLTRRDARSSLSWCLLITFLPVVGIPLYLLLGAGVAGRRDFLFAGEEQSRKCEQDLYGEEFGVVGLADELLEILQLGAKLTQRTLVPGNRLIPLVNGEQAYPEMLAAIASARSSIFLSTYQFDDDEAGQSFAVELARASGRGVRVRVLVDALGVMLHRPTIVRRLRSLGVTVAAFNPLGWRLWRINHRNHRKILIVDDRVAFTGGMNIRAVHWVERSSRPLLDVHFRVEGPVVERLVRVFAADWQAATGELLDFSSGRLSQGRFNSVGAALVREIISGPGGCHGSVRSLIMGAITSACKSIQVVTPYFLPSEDVVGLLCLAAMRGIRVEIIIPEKTFRLIDWSVAALLPALLRSGCRVYLARPYFDHSKLLVIDEAWVLVGSANWDARSLDWNLELCLECVDPEFAASIISIIKSKGSTSREMFLAEFEQRSVGLRIRDGLASLFAPLL